MYVNKDTGQNVSLDELAEQLNCSIPANPDAAAQDALGVTELVQTPAPSPCHHQGSNALVGGEWTTTWLAPSDEEMRAIALATHTSALEAHYDTAAREKKYDNRLTCALRAGYPGPFQAEGIAFAVWMDSCNAYGYEQIAKVIAGEREMPTPTGMISELPELVWP